MAYNQRTYTESDATKRWRQQMDNHAAAKPGEYTSQWTAQRDDALGAITNRDPFSYDVNGDAMWHQYKDRYTTMGKQAMADTMGQAAALTGGYGNSQAQIAGQQVYQGYMQGLADKIPELAQHALDRYNQETQNLYDRYNLYNNQEQSDYARYQDQYQQWQADRDYYANQYNTERGYDYNVYRDNVSDDQWKANFDEDTRRWNYQNQKNSSGGSGGGNGGNGGNGDTGGNPVPGPYNASNTENIWLNDPYSGNWSGVNPNGQPQYQYGETKDDKKKKAGGYNKNTVAQRY